jgi:Ca2+-binding RTX toxin-like protein
MIEHLESRRLLAVTTGFSSGVLTVTGDADANHVFIGRNLDTSSVFVKVNDAIVRTVPLANLTSIKVSLLGGNDSLETAPNVEKPMTISGGEGNDVLTGGGGKDSIAGDAGNDFLRGGPGADSLYGGDGDDRLDGGPHADLLSGGGGRDTADYGMRIDPLKITLDNAANDGGIATTTHPSEGDNVKTDIERVIGGRANDYISAAPTVTSTGTITPGSVTLDGNAGNDTLIGTNGGDSTVPTPNSVLLGRDGNDSLVGGSKNDIFDGGGGNDTFKGNDGNDTLLAGPGADFMSGGGGSDLISYVNAPAGVVVTLNDNLANDGAPANATTGFPGEHDNTQSDIERIAGTRFNDKLTGTDSANTIGGGDGNDTIYGQGGNDLLEGGNGNDILHGGAGNDSIYGSAGNDSLYGEDGNDWLYSKDTIKDIVDGGGGTEDHASRDSGIDVVTNVEFYV